MTVYCHIDSLLSTDLLPALVVLRSVRLEPLDEFLRAAERRQVAAIDLVRCDAQTIADDAPHELGGKEAIVPAQEELCWYVRPRVQRPRLLEGCTGLILAVMHRLRRHVRREVMEEGDHWVELAVRGAALTLVLCALCLFVAGVCPPVSR